MRDQRGAVLGIAIGIAFICSVAAYAILIIARSQVGPTRLFRERLRARYAAEAGMIWAMQQLWNDPNWNSGVGADFTLTDAQGSFDVDVVTSPGGAPWNRKIEVHVIY